MREVQVEAACRLHFGLYSFGGAGRTYGGVGVMVAPPRVRLTIRSSDHTEVRGPLADRARRFCQCWLEHHDRSDAAIALQVEQAPPQHVGLGLGTALGMAAAAGLRAWFEMPPGTAEELAASVGRGRRSAVGAHGFVHGGLIAEAGRAEGEPLSQLQQRVALPEEWRFVLARPAAAPGLSGDRESQAFSSLPPVTPERREQLIGIAQAELMPAAAAGDFQPFAESLHRFGRLAGECFAPLQGGPYNGPQVSELVDQIRQLGYRGAGQSSWGPSVFAATPDVGAAQRLCQQLQAWRPGLETSVARVANHGARVSHSS